MILRENIRNFFKPFKLQNIFRSTEIYLTPKSRLLNFYCKIQFSHVKEEILNAYKLEV